MQRLLAVRGYKQAICFGLLFCLLFVDVFAGHKLSAECMHRYEHSNSLSLFCDLICFIVSTSVVIPISYGNKKRSNSRSSPTMNTHFLLCQLNKTIILFGSNSEIKL